MSNTYEHRIERVGRQTTHYITSNDMIMYFVRRPGQTEEQMRERGEWIANTLNETNDDARLPYELLLKERNQLQWLLGEADEMASHYKAERDKLLLGYEAVT